MLSGCHKNCCALPASSGCLSGSHRYRKTLFNDLLRVSLVLPRTETLVQKLGVPRETFVQGRKIGFRDRSHRWHSYIIIQPRKKNSNSHGEAVRRGWRSPEEIGGSWGGICSWSWTAALKFQSGATTMNACLSGTSAITGQALTGLGFGLIAARRS